MIADVVHTTGINIDGFLANCAAIVVIVGAFMALVTRTVRGSIRDEIQSVIEREVSPRLDKIDERLNTQDRRLDGHDVALSRLQGIEEGKRQAVAQAAVHRNQEAHEK